MKPTAALIRAISMEFISRKFKSLLIPIGIVGLVCLIITIILTAINSWWLLLLVPLIIVLSIGLLLSMFARTIINMARPNLSTHQAILVKDFVDKLERVTENVQTPMFIIVFKVARDSVHPHGASFIRDATKDGASLSTDFIKLVKKFND